MKNLTGEPRKGASPPRAFDDTGDKASAVGPPLGPYCLTVTAQASSRFVGEIEGGYRVDLDYRGSGPSVKLEDALGTAGLRPEARNRLRSASVMSGNDWVFVSKTGVASFDSRITLAIGTRGASGDQAVIGARIRGRVDLRRTRDKTGAPLYEDASDGDVLAGWMAGFGDDCAVPLALSVAFEVPSSGFDPKEDEVYRDCRELERCSFVGLGRATLRPGPNSPFKTIELKIYRLDGRPVAVIDQPTGGRT